jgi:hypothetical protein
MFREVAGIGNSFGCVVYTIADRGGADGEVANVVGAAGGVEAGSFVEAPR